MKSCINCNSLASDIILSVLSVNSEVPVRLNLECEASRTEAELELKTAEILDFSYMILECFLVFLLALVTPEYDCCEHGN